MKPSNKGVCRHVQPTPQAPDPTLVHVSPLPPWWAYEDSTPMDLWSLPRPGDPDWQDPIDCRDLGPLSDEPVNDGRLS